MGILGSIGKGLAAIVGEALQDGQSGEAERRWRATGNPFAVPLSDTEKANLKLGNEEKEKALSSMGVEISLLSEGKIVSESVSLLNGLCGQKLTSRDKPSSVKNRLGEPHEDWQGSEEGGESHVIFDKKNGDSTICHLWYGRDLEPYAADVYVWKGDNRHDYTVRTVEGSMTVQHEAFTTPARTSRRSFTELAVPSLH